MPRQAGAISLQLLVIMVPVLFGLMGFALDLGRLYLIRGELNQAANTMALAAAQQLFGTVNSVANATTVAQTSLDNSGGAANTYNFGSIVVGQNAGNLASTVNPPVFFASMADVTASFGGGGSNQADGTMARFVQISLQADAPLVFLALLPGGESRKTSVAAQAVAGISTPLCTACNIEPFAIANLDGTGTDTVNFGLTLGQLYTFNFSCSGTQPNPVAGTLRLPYVFINRFDANNGNLDETQQLYRDFAGGLVSSPNPNPTGSAVPLACAGINDPAETLWVSAVPGTCTLSAPASVHEALCGLQTRQDNSDPNGVCAGMVTDWTDLSALYPPDSDVNTGQSDDYTAYSGNGRRIFTVPVVDALAGSTNTTMTVLGFRQFLLEPSDTLGSALNPSQPNGQFVAMYIGSPAPVKTGWVDDRFSLSCPVPVASGPGKVVLHR